MVADVINNMDSATNWHAGSCASITASTATKHEGAASIECVNLSQGNNHHWYYRLGSAADLSAYSNIGFWIYSSLSIPSGDFNFAFSSANNLSSPQLLNITAAITANTWTYIVLNFGSASRSSILSYGFRQNTADSAINHANIYIDDILAGPGLPTFPGGGVVGRRS
jgi:hypothetical protein